MSRSEFLVFKIRLVTLLFFWLISVIAIIGFWDRINIFFKIIFIAYCCIVVPGIDTFEQLFLSYKKYQREGL